MSRDFQNTFSGLQMRCLQQSADASEGKCQDTVVASGDDIVNRETSLSTSCLGFAMDGVEFFFFLYERLIDERNRAAYFYLPILLRNSRIRLCIRREKLSFFAFLFRNQSVFSFSLFSTSRWFLICCDNRQRCKSKVLS